MKKRVLSALLGVAMVSTLLVGCGGDKPAEDTKAPETTDAPAEDDKAETPAASEDLSFEIVSKGFQHQFWQAVLKGSEQKAKELGVKINFVGPDSESAIAEQVQQLTNAINKKPNAIGFAALDTDACLDAIKQAQDSGIPIIEFDSGVGEAAGDAVFASASTDNYAAGELAAQESYADIKEAMSKATGAVRIGVMGQDATSESIVQRGLGFIDKITELAEADGKTVSVEGNDKYVSDSKAGKKDGADVILDVAVPSQVTAELSVIDCQNLMNKADTIAIYGSNQHSGEAMVNANNTLQKFGKGEGKIIGVTFDSGAVIKGAVADGTFVGAVTQAPVAMGEALVDLLVKAAKGEKVENVDTGAQWYTASNMEDAEIAQNLYD